MPEKRFLSRADVANELGVGTHVVDGAIRRGELLAVRIGGRVLIRRDSLDRLIANCAVTKQQGRKQKTPST